MIDPQAAEASGHGSRRTEQLIEAVRRAEVIDLAQPLEPGMPHSPNHAPFTLALVRRHGDRPRPDGSSGASELLIMAAHSGTHIDALCHIADRGQLHGGVDAFEAQREGRFRQLGIETVPPFIGRGVLLDVADYRGEAPLPPAYEIDADDLEATARRQGVAIEPGDAVLIRTGWSVHWGRPDAFVGHESGVPGVGVAGAEWLCRHRIRLAGSDTLAYERILPGQGHRLLPVHTLLLVRSGVPIVECLQLEELARRRIYRFVLIVTPLKIVGGTGSPVRVVALV